MNNKFETNLKDDLSIALSRYNQKKDIESLKDIIILQDICREQKIKNVFDNNYNMNKLIYRYQRISNKHYKLIKKSVFDNKENHLSFAKLYNLININLEGQDLSIYTNLDDSVDIARDFMNKYNIKMYDTFEWMRNNKRIRIKKNSNGSVGGYVYLTNIINPYMVINSKGNIYDASCFVHETAHIIHNQSSIIKETNYPYFYNEVYSNYTQLLFLKYMEDNNFYKDDIKKIKLKKIISLENYLRRMEFNIKRNYVYEDNFQYGYGIALALYYYNMYLDDPELAEYYMDWFIKCSSLFEQNEVLNKFGITKEKIITKNNINSFLK